MTVPSSAVREQRVLVAGDGARLGGGDEAGADPDAVGAERQSGGQAAPVEDAAGGDDRHALADRVDDLGHERHRRDVPVWPPASVPWATTRSQPASTAAMAWRTLPHMLTTSTLLLVAQVDDVAGHAEPGDEDAGARRGDDVARLSLDPVGHRGEQVDAERLVGELAHLRRSRATSSSPLMCDAPSAAETAGLGDRGDEPVVRDAAHAGEHDGVLDVEELGQSSAHAPSVPSNLTARVKARGALAGCSAQTDTRVSGSPRSSVMAMGARDGVGAGARYSGGGAATRGVVRLLGRALLGGGAKGAGAVEESAVPVGGG